jgi:hypothetical protein
MYANLLLYEMSVWFFEAVNFYDINVARYQMRCVIAISIRHALLTSRFKKGNLADPTNACDEKGL